MSNNFREYIKLNKNVPAEALRFAVGTDITVDDTGEKGVRVHLKARAKQPISHPMFGNVVHDFGSMSVNKKIALDWEHETNIGYTKSFSITDYGLEIDGLIFKNTENPSHPANEVIYNLKNGIPLESSIDFRSSYDIVEVSPDEKVMVNGILFSDGIIIKNWTLKKIAICALGQDPTTTATAQFKSTEILNPNNLGQFMQTETSEDVVKTDVSNSQSHGNATVNSDVVKADETLALVPDTPVQKDEPVATPEDVVVKEDVPVAEVVVEQEAVVETPKVEDPIVVELKGRIAELESQLESTKSAEKMHLQTIDELVIKHKKVAESFGAEPIQNSFENVKEFKNWQECVATVMTQYGLGDSDAHCKAIKLYPEFHKKQISKFNL